ncbi:hypothetical protein ESCO_004226 [Escovopsis weberi]|uniref:AA1-like domain-containing protein n=1 Tax=Escovopsis weberi TaxID=150374 RepID=A0A0M8N6U7_ESCWE|nr:hypothetical protein ESCO_004226 [Escovopsis weberi]
MQLQLLSLLALACGSASVSAMSFAGLAYRPTYDMVAMAEANNCTFPAHFRIHDFIGTTSAAGGANASAPLDAFNFKFEDDKTGARTFCQWNASSVSSTPAGLTPRFSCEDSNVKFIWEDGQRELTGIERICPDQQSGKPGAEVSGSVKLFLTCSARGICTANSTDVEGTYYSLGPVLDPTST